MTALNPPRSTLSLRRTTGAAATLASPSRPHTVPNASQSDAQAENPRPEFLPSDAPKVARRGRRRGKGRAHQVSWHSDVALKPVEEIVLQLVNLDPRLTRRNLRHRLIYLVGFFAPRRSKHRVAMALAFLRDYNAAGIVRTHAFVEADTDEVPMLADCRYVFDALVRTGEPGLWSPARIAGKWPEVALAFGHRISAPWIESGVRCRASSVQPSMELDLAVRTPTNPFNDGI